MWYRKRQLIAECSPSDLQAKDDDLPGGSEVVDMTGGPSNNTLEVMAMILTYVQLIAVVQLEISQISL